MMSSEFKNPSSPHLPESWVERVQTKCGVKLTEHPMNLVKIEASRASRPLKQRLAELSSMLDQTKEDISSVNHIIKVVSNLPCSKISGKIVLGIKRDDGSIQRDPEESPTLDPIKLIGDLKKLKGELEIERYLTASAKDYYSGIRKQTKLARNDYWKELWLIWTKQLGQNPRCSYNSDLDTYSGKVVDFVMICSETLFGENLQPSQVVAFWNGKNGLRKRFSKELSKS